jgi:hypothetical protein
MGIDNLGHRHCKAICDEIGDRLRFYLDRSSSDLPSRLLELLGRLEDQEKVASPSIVHDLEVAEVDSDLVVEA